MKYLIGELNVLFSILSLHKGLIARGAGAQGVRRRRVLEDLDASARRGIQF